MLLLLMVVFIEKKIYKRLKRIDGDGLVIYGSKCRHLKIILIHNAGRRTVVAFKKIYESWNFLNEKYKGVEGAEEKFKMINEKHEAFTTPQITLKEFFEV
ncbi:hypothetical protein RIR_jg11821.t1 [Rhizophagus irregularis DAOM 181602=DAOM 197198]|nr:hypothetical protein RIR_jg11821.t1 [Rhizophagus irregularis DAOM 181602=DAOM 197198]